MSKRIRYTLNQLKVFSTVAELSGFARAAESLHLATPTVSMQVKQLADAIGMPLFEQVGKRIYLTDAGRSVLDAAKSVFATLDSLESRVAQMRGLKVGHLKIAVVTTAKYFIPRLLGPFVREYPGIDIALEVGNRSDIVARLSRNEDDLCVMGMPPDHLDIERLPFVANPIVAIAPVGHPLAQRKRVPLETIARESFIMREKGSGTRLAVDEFLQRKGIGLKVRMELGSNEAIKQAVAGGLGLSMLSLHAVTRELERREIEVVRISGLPLRRSWHIVRRSGKELSPIAEIFLEYLRNMSRPIEEELAAWL